MPDVFILILKQIQVLDFVCEFYSLNNYWTNLIFCILITLVKTETTTKTQKWIIVLQGIDQGEIHKLTPNLTPLYKHAFLLIRINS